MMAVQKLHKMKRLNACFTFRQGAGMFFSGCSLRCEAARMDRKLGPAKPKKAEVRRGGKEWSDPGCESSLGGGHDEATDRCVSREGDESLRIDRSLWRSREGRAEDEADKSVDLRESERRNAT